LPSIIYIILFIFILFSPVNFHLHYHRKDKDDYFLMEMGFRGLYFWKYQVPITKIYSMESIKQIQLTKGPGDKTKKEINKDLYTLVAEIMDIESALKKYGLGGTLFYLFLPKKYRRWVSVAEKLEKRGKFTRLVWRTVIGRDDPAVTGRVIGLLWVAKGVTMGYLQSVYNFKKLPRVVVIPCFTGTTWESLLDCIFEIELGHIIFTGIKEFIIEALGGRKDAGTPN
jgi:hypothetical protein